MVVSIPPKTHCSLTSLSQLYFRRVKTLSSISTIHPGPPICTGFLMKCSAQRSQRSQRNIFQSTNACIPILNSHCVCQFLVRPSVNKFNNCYQTEIGLTEENVISDDFPRVTWPSTLPCFPILSRPFNHVHFYYSFPLQSAHIFGTKQSSHQNHPPISQHVVVSDSFVNVG